MKEKIRTIDLKQFIKYCFERFYVVIPVVALCMGILVSMNYREQKEIVESSKKEIISRVMNQNHRAYYYKSDKFTDAETPKGVYNSMATIYVDFNFNDVELKGGVDLATYSGMVGNDLIDILVDLPTLEKVINELDLRSYSEFSNLSAERFKWMINKNFLGAHVLKFVVSDIDPERAKLIADKLLEKFLVNVEKYNLVDSVKVIGYPNVPEDSGLFSTSSEVIQTGISKKEILKYAIVGGILGVCLIGAILFVIFIVCDTVRTENDLAFADIQQLVSINRRKPDYKRIAYSLDFEENDNKNILFVAVGKKVDAEKVASSVKDELKSINKSIKVSYAGDFVREADALSKAREADGIVYLVRYGKTKMKDLINAKNSLDRFETQNIGGMIL